MLLPLGEVAVVKQPGLNAGVADDKGSVERDSVAARVLGAVGDKVGDVCVRRGGAEGEGASSTGAGVRGVG